MQTSKHISTGDIMKDKFYFAEKHFLYFMAYSVIGWIYEVFLEVAVYRWGYSDRGILIGPYCPVYGVGALIFLFTVYKLINGKETKKRILFIPVVFVLCSLSATLTELIASYVCEFFTGKWQWQTYADYKYNFQARIALSPSVRFGIGGVIFLYILQPIFEAAVNKISRKNIDIIFFLLITLFIFDLLYFFVKI